MTLFLELILPLAAVTTIIAVIAGLIALGVEDMKCAHRVFWGIVLWPVSLFKIITGKGISTENHQDSTFRNLEKRWVNLVLKDAERLVRTGVSPADAVWSVVNERHEHTQLLLSDGNGPKFKSRTPDDLYRTVTDSRY